MSNRQWKRLDAVERIGQGRLTLWEAAAVLSLSKRQVRRLRRAVERRGAEGVVHGNIGRAPTHRMEEAVRERIVDLRRKKYAGFNDQHFTEKLCEVEGVKISRASVQRILRAAGIGPPRRRRAPKHRRRRDRKSQAGLMILWDGSRHEWLEERGPMLCLITPGRRSALRGRVSARAQSERCAKLYITNLSNLAQPLIRYELTDELRILDEPCPCGTAFRRVDDIEGRSDDLFTYPGGIVVHPLVFRSPLGRERHIVEYQVHHTPSGSAIRLRTDGEVDIAALSRRIADALLRAGVKAPQVTVSRVEAFARQATGKLKRFFPVAAR